MPRQTCTLDQLIDQTNMSKHDRETTKAQIHRAEVIVDVVEVCVSSVIRRLKPLTNLRTRRAHQY